MLSLPCEKCYTPQRREYNTNVEMTWQRSIYSINVTNNHVGLEVQGLHTTYCCGYKFILSLVALLVLKIAQPMQDQNMKYT